MFKYRKIFTLHKKCSIVFSTKIIFSSMLPFIVICNQLITILSITISRKNYSKLFNEKQYRYFATI